MVSDTSSPHSIPPLISSGATDGAWSGTGAAYSRAEVIADSYVAHVARSVERDGVLYMKGFLRGVIQDAGPNTKFSGVQSIPIKKINGSTLTDGRVAANASACDILNLVLGPLDLNLLGLEIHLQRVVLDIVAVAGAGNLLGNLLCAVAGLLDGGPLAGLLGQLQTLLNQILGALNLGV